MGAWVGLGALGAGLAAGGFAYAANWPTSQIFGRTIVAGNDPAEIALTYDDGPNPAVTPALLEVLGRHGVRATFFLIGRYVQTEGALVREIAAAGHALGCHTMTHPKLTLLPEVRVREEIAGSQRAVEDAAGQAVRLFRPPHGARRPVVMGVARELGMETVMWNTIVGDWNPVSAEVLVERMNVGLAKSARAGQGANVVLHDGGHLGLGADRRETVRATEMFVAGRGGVRWVTAGEWGGGASEGA